MADKKKFLLRIDETIYYAIEKWASDELRSANAQIEFILKDALRKSGRLQEKESGSPDNKNNNNTNQ
ncbi:MAG: Arc family DNA-binding protein [Bacteroidota bacterium]